MPTRRKFRRNNRKTRRRGKRGSSRKGFKESGHEYKAICDWFRQSGSDKPEYYALNKNLVANLLHQEKQENERNSPSKTNSY